MPHPNGKADFDEKIMGSTKPDEKDDDGQNEKHGQTSFGSSVAYDNYILVICNKDALEDMRKVWCLGLVEAINGETRTSNVRLGGEVLTVKKTSLKHRAKLVQSCTSARREHTRHLHMARAFIEMGAHQPPSFVVWLFCLQGGVSIILYYMKQAIYDMRKM